MAEQIERLVDDFLASVRARGLSPKTLREYRFPLHAVLLPYCRHHDVGEPAQLTRPVLDRLSAQLLEEGGKSGRPLSRHTIASYLRSINVFLSWAHAEGEAVTARAKAPSTGRRRYHNLRVAHLSNRAAGTNRGGGSGRRATLGA